MTTKDRIQALQRYLNVEPDGIIGPITLSAIEKSLGMTSTTKIEPPSYMEISQDAFDMIVRHEVTSKEHYEGLRQPYWPGGNSGATIGIGYDLGHATYQEIIDDWGPAVSHKIADRMIGATGRDAKIALERNPDPISVPWEDALRVFRTRSLPKYAGMTLKAFPGVENLFPDAQGALLSLVYNRGASMRGDRRLEMRKIRELVACSGSSKEISWQIATMARLWPGNLRGLYRRRINEAWLVEHSDRDYKPEEIIRLEVRND